MKLTITSIRLRTPFQFFPLSLYAMHILKQLNATNCLQVKKAGFWKDHYTMTLWNSEKELKAFARSGAHLQAMKKGPEIAAEIATLTMDMDKMPSWKEAKNLLRERGKPLRY